MRQRAKPPKGAREAAGGANSEKEQLPSRTPSSPSESDRWSQPTAVGLNPLGEGPSVPTELPVRSRRPESNTGVRTGVEAAAAPMAGMPKRRKSAGRVPVADPNPTPPQISKVLLRQGRERALDEVPIEDAPPPKRKPSKAAGRALRPPSREEHPRSPAVPRPRPVAEGVSAKPDATDREPDEPAPASAEIADVRGLSTFGEIGPPRGPHRAAVASMSWRERLLRRDELLNIVGALLTALLAFAALWMLLSFFW